MVRGWRTPTGHPGHHVSLQSERSVGQSSVHDLFCRQIVCKAFRIGVVNEIENARMRYVRFENLNELIVFLLRPICDHDSPNELDELIASKVTHVHHASLVIVGVQPARCACA